MRAGKVRHRGCFDQRLLPVAGRLRYRQGTLGYQKFSDGQAASKALQKIISDQLGQGFAPVDEHAHAIVEKLSVKMVEPQRHALPFRLDLAVDNEANGFTIHGRQLLGADISDGEVASGARRYHGKLTQGQWLLESSFPELNQEQLGAAMELARQVQGGKNIMLVDPSEGPAIKAYALKAYPYHFEDNPPVHDKQTIRLKEADEGLLRILGAATFFTRFKGVWTVVEVVWRPLSSISRRLPVF